MIAHAALSFCHIIVFVESTSESRKLTWKMASLWTAIVFMASSAFGIWLLGQRIFLAPPWAAYTADLYWLIGLSPPLIVYVAFALARPAGRSTVLAALTGFVVIVFIIYLYVIGPLLYTDIQCNPASGPQGRLTCGCYFDSSHGSGAFECQAVKLPNVPFIKLTREKDINPQTDQSPGLNPVRDFIN
jgi:hypothetical protein